MIIKNVWNNIMRLMSFFTTKSNNVLFNNYTNGKRKACLRR